MSSLWGRLAAVAQRRVEWENALKHLREVSDVAADARGEYLCDRCDHRTHMWSHGDAQWQYGTGWACDECYEQDLEERRNIELYGSVAARIGPGLQRSALGLEAPPLSPESEMAREIELEKRAP